MPSRGEVRRQQDIKGRLAPAIHETQTAPYDIPSAWYAAFMQPVHDIGGEPDVPVPYEEKEEEQWELNTYVTCEVLAWRGVAYGMLRRDAAAATTTLASRFTSAHHITDVGSLPPLGCSLTRTSSRLPS
jgi:hypothetical protein